MTNELIAVVTEELMVAFGDKYAPTRKYLVQQISSKHPDLVYPRMDADIGLGLNAMVDKGTLRRFGGKFYAPGKHYCRK